MLRTLLSAAVLAAFSLSVCAQTTYAPKPLPTYAKPATTQAGDSSEALAQRLSALEGAVRALREENKALREQVNESIAITQMMQALVKGDVPVASFEEVKRPVKEKEKKKNFNVSGAAPAAVAEPESLMYQPVTETNGILSRWALVRLNRTSAVQTEYGPLQAAFRFDKYGTPILVVSNMQSFAMGLDVYVVCYGDEPDMSGNIPQYSMSAHLDPINPGQSDAVRLSTPPRMDPANFQRVLVRIEPFGVTPLTMQYNPLGQRPVD